MEAMLQMCSLDQVLSPNLIELLKVSPQNPALRTHVHARINVPLPDSAQTFDQIKTWIETHVDAKTLPPLACQPVQAVPPERPIEPGFHMPFDCSENRWGTCTWSGAAIGDGSVRIGLRHVREIIHENLDEDFGIGDLTDAVGEMIVREAEEDPPCMEVEEEDHDDHETTGSDDFQVNYSRATLVLRLTRFLHDHFRDHFDRLGLTLPETD